MDGTQEQVDILNAKSLDLMLFANALSGKRYSLNKLSQALTNQQKTLTSGEEGIRIYKDYLKT
jgi:hypothetical protein